MNELTVGLMIHMLGLGDHVSCNALIRRLIIEHKLEGMYVCAWRQYGPTVRNMFSDDPRIQVVEIYSGGEYHAIRELIQTIKPYKLYLLGHESTPGQTFDDIMPKLTEVYRISYSEAIQKYQYSHKNYYDFLGVDWKHRFISTYYDRNIQEESRVFDKLNPNHEEYVFVQDDPNRGFSFDNNKLLELTGSTKIIYNDPSEEILDLGMIIQNAKQVHVMESSIRCLIETIPTEGVEFYLHHYIRNTERLVYDGKICHVETRKPWNVIL
jgi:hypothetical protein